MQIIPNITVNPVSQRLALLIRQLHKLEPAHDALPAFPKQITAMRNINVTDSRRIPARPETPTLAGRQNVGNTRTAGAAQLQFTRKPLVPWVSQVTNLANIARKHHAESSSASPLMRRVEQELPAAQTNTRSMKKPAPQASARPLSPVAQFACRNMLAQQALLKETGTTNAAASPFLSTIPVPDEHRLATDSRSITKPTVLPAPESSPKATRSDSAAATRDVKRQPSTTVEGANRLFKTAVTTPSVAVSNAKSPHEALLAELLAKTASKRADEHLTVRTEARTAPVIVAEHRKPQGIRMGTTERALMADLASREKVVPQVRMNGPSLPDASTQSQAKETPTAVTTDQAQRARADAAPSDPRQTALETARRLATEVAADRESAPMALIDNTGTKQPEKSALRSTSENAVAPTAGKPRLTCSDEVLVNTFETDSDVDSDYSSNHEAEDAASSQRRTRTVDSTRDPMAPPPVHFVGRPIS